MKSLVHGAMAMGNVVIALFFLRFHRERRDLLFLLFGIAFGLFALNNVIAGVSSGGAEAAVEAYVVRLIGFGLIIAAIIYKNRG